MVIKSNADEMTRPSAYDPTPPPISYKHGPKRVRSAPHPRRLRGRYGWMEVGEGFPTVAE